jgi:hypothetical protein
MQLKSVAVALAAVLGFDGLVLIALHPWRPQSPTGWAAFLLFAFPAISAGAFVYNMLTRIEFSDQNELPGLKASPSWKRITIIVLALVAFAALAVTVAAYL